MRLSHWCALRSLFSLLFALVLFTYQARAQQTYIYGTFSGAIYVSPAAYTQAVQVQCPADHPVRCDAIQQPNFCCAAGYYCGVASANVVGCCANGQTCSGAIGGTSTLYPVVVTVTSYYTPGNTGVVVAGGYYTITTTVYGTPAPAPYVVTTATTVDLNRGYCSTLTANGPGLPTVRQGACGDILVVSEASKSRVLWSTAAVVGLLGLVLSM